MPSLIASISWSDASAAMLPWFVGVMALMMYTIFAMTLYLLPPQAQ